MSLLLCSIIKGDYRHTMERMQDDREPGEIHQYRRLSKTRIDRKQTIFSYALSKTEIHM